MRIAASVVGISGALCGIFFAQLVVSVGMMLAIVTSATRGTPMQLGNEFLAGLIALGIFAIGVAGGVAVIPQPLVGVPLLLLSAVGGLVAMIVINGAPAEQTGSLVTDVFPYLGPVLLFIGAVFGVFDLRSALRAATASVDARTPRSASITMIPVAPMRAQLASAVAMPLLAQPVPNASSVRDIEPGTEMESMEQQGEFVHVRGQDFDGFLPSWSVRRVA